MANKETKSPLKAKPLRNPGQSVRERRFDLAYEKILAPVLMTIMTGYWAVMEWVAYFFPQVRKPWMMTIATLAVGAWAVWQIKRYWPEITRLRLAEDGEKAVGQLLESLRGGGYKVFHDVIGNDFNVDHVVIGPAGVYAIETKTWSKPAKGSPKIHFDGVTLRANGLLPDRDPIVQAKAQAQWLKSLLMESTGKEFPVHPVVLFPGWFIEAPRESLKDIWVLEAKGLSKFLENAAKRLEPDDVHMASFHLMQFVCAQEQRIADSA